MLTIKHTNLQVPSGAILLFLTNDWIIETVLSMCCRSLIDLNRAGAPLMELVFEPELSDGEEAAALIKELSLILTSLNTCLCKMEGQFANITHGLKLELNNYLVKEEYYNNY